MIPAIQVENLSKLYKIGHLRRRSDTLRDQLVAILRGLWQHKPTGEDEIWALKDVSFEVQPGEVVGVIGRNGAGKSTLLKILARITEPTSGRAVINGRIGSLLEVGTGFHPELTGRENIYLNGAILGMRRQEINRRFDEIVAFSEIEKFLDTPVKRYSSGMYVRLAFAVAAHLEPEILLVDEVLAVGDAAFQKKCLGKMGEVAKLGRTVLFVSHSMAAIRNLCARSLWINNGNLEIDDSTSNVVNKYLSRYETNEGELILVPDSYENKYKKARLRRVTVIDSQGRVRNLIPIETPLAIEIEYEIYEYLPDARVGFRLLSSNGEVVFTSEDTDPGGQGTPRKKGIYVSRCVIPANFLNTGRYFISVVGDLPLREFLFLHENIVTVFIQLTGGVGSAIPDGRLGVVRPSLTWEINEIRGQIFTSG
jgi:lipopolysaccharide transport system ATP-binding protein